MPLADGRPIHVVLAARGGAKAKSRLAALPADERSALVAAMLADMLAVLLPSPAFASVTVVTPTPEIAAVARAAGAAVMAEPAGGGINAAFAAAREAIVARDADALLCALPADLPLLAPGELEAAAARAVQGTCVLVPAHDGEGTGAVIAPAAAELAFAFGSDSLQCHCRAVAQAGLEALIVPSPGLSHDVDSAADLAEAARLAPASRTAAFVRHLSPA